MSNGQPYSNKNIYWIAGVFLLLVVVYLLSDKSDTDVNRSDENVAIVETEVPIPPPPVLAFNVSKHKKKVLEELFKKCNGEKRDLIRKCDYTNAAVRNQSKTIAGQHAGNLNLGQICDLYDFCKDDWRYVNDPINADISEYASKTLENGKNGDCDDFAVLLCSMILSVGGDARINYAYNGSSGHAFTEVNIGSTNKQTILNYLSSRYKTLTPGDHLNTREDHLGNCWMNLDWFSPHPGGQYFEFTSGTTFYILERYCESF